MMWAQNLSWGTKKSARSSIPFSTRLDVEQVNLWEQIAENPLVLPGMLDVPHWTY